MIGPNWQRQEAPVHIIMDVGQYVQKQRNIEKNTFGSTGELPPYIQENLQNFEI